MIGMSLGDTIETRRQNSAKGKKVKKISRQSMREKSVSNVLASLNIEQLTPSPKVIKGMQACMAGTTSTDRLLADAINRHVAIRRI